MAASQTACEQASCIGLSWNRRVSSKHGERIETRSNTLVLDWQAIDTESLKYTFSDRSMNYEDQQSINGTPLTSVIVTVPTGAPPPNDTSSFPYGTSTVTRPVLPRHGSREVA